MIGFLAAGIACTATIISILMIIGVVELWDLLKRNIAARYWPVLHSAAQRSSVSDCG